MLTREDEALTAAVAARRLTVWEITQTWRPQPCVLALDTDVHNQICAAWDDPNSALERLRAQVHAAFDAFVAGTVTLPMLFKETGGRLMTAEMRILSPKPGVRVLGGFLSDSVFVGVSKWLRDELPFKHNRAQTAAARVTWEELNRGTAERLREILGDVALHRPRVLRRRGR
jgi:hypothetical protein